MSEAGQVDVVEMSDEDAARIGAWVDESAARIAETVRGIRASGDMRFRGNVVEMLAVLVVLRYLDNEEGKGSSMTIELCDDGPLGGEAHLPPLPAFALSVEPILLELNCVEPHFTWSDEVEVEMGTLEGEVLPCDQEG